MFLNLSKKQNHSKTMDFIDKHTGCHPGGAVKNQQQNSKLQIFFPLLLYVYINPLLYLDMVDSLKFSSQLYINS